ncbi:hypothetical protein Tco_0184218 [Tanacetum coccineum]
MYYKKNMDFVALIWEDLAYQIDNMDSKKQDKMFYPRFMKIIINYFLEKDKSSLMRNRTFMHTARDDSLLGTIRFISRHADTQVYDAIIPISMTNQALLDPVAYKTYYAIALGAEPPKVLDEQDRKTSGTDEGTGTKPGVLDVPKYDSECDKESWGDSGEEEDDDENNSEDEYDDDDDDDNQEVDDTNDDDEETDKEEEKIDDEETMDDEEDDEVTKELYKDVNVNLGNEDIDTIDADQEFTNKLLNLENPSLADNEIASLMDTIVHHEELRIDRYIDNKLGEAIQKAIVEYKLDCREDAQAKKTNYIEIVDTSMRAILKEEVNTQLPQILPQAVSDFATPVIEKNVTESLEAAVLARSSSQANSTYEAAASLSEFELTKILIDKMEKKKSYDKADYKRELYDTLVKSYQTDKDLFDTYSKVFKLKRSRDDRDKDQDPSAGFDQGMKRRKSSKEAKSSRDLRSKENNPSSTFRDASHSQHKHSDKSAHVEEPSHTVDDSGVQQDQEFDTGNNDEQPADKEVSKDD